MRRAIFGIWLLLLLLAIPSTPAEASTSLIGTGVGNSFSSASYEIDQGDSVVFSNTGSQRHNLKSTSLFEGDFLFGSETVQPTGTGPVEGVEYLDTGSYPFFCTFHPGMEATLVVGPTGTPRDRPRVTTRILTQSKKVLARKGYLRIELRSEESVPSVDLRVVGAARELTRLTVDLTADLPKVVDIRLPDSFRRRVGGMKVVRFSIRGSVPYGTFEAASRAFR